MFVESRSTHGHCVSTFLAPVSLQYARPRFERTEPLGRMFDELAVLHVRATTDAVVFRPVLGSLLTGKVHSVGAGHIALLVGGVFNVIVFASDLAPWYAYSAAASAWVGTSAYDDSISSNAVLARNPRSICSNAEITFRVKTVTYAAGLVSLEGCLGPLG